jgi:hypothetical protein
MYSLVKIVKGYKPLACADECIVLSKGSCLYLADLDLLNIKFLCRLPALRILYHLPRFRLLERILRLSISSFLILNDKWGLAVRKNEIWRVNLLDGTVSLDFLVPENRKILALTLVKDVDGFEDSIVFGEYFNNPSMLPVNIWRCPLVFPGSWSIGFTFSAGQINHVHNVVVDADRSALWVLTGDFDKAARICLTSKNFEEMKVILSGNQQYRATWIHRLKGTVFYATDSQLEANSLCALDEQDDGITSQKLAKTEGSSIYAAIGKYEIFFSTAVEPVMPTGNMLIDLFETKIGEGIASHQSVIYEVTHNGLIKELFRANKDIWPMNLAQFGTFTFPSGVMPDGKFYAYGCALSKFDDACLMFLKNELSRRLSENGKYGKMTTIYSANRKL